MRNYQSEFNDLKKDILDSVRKNARYIYIFIEYGSNITIRTDIYFTRNKVVIFLYSEVELLSKYNFKFVEETDLEKFWSTSLGRAIVCLHNAKLIMVKHEH